MPKIYVAWRDEDAPNGTPPRYARPSMNALRVIMKAEPGSRWVVGTYDYKWLIAEVCQAIEDPSELAADGQKWFSVDEEGVLHEEKEPE